MTTLLNPRHERFAQELAKGQTAEKAYILAGYAPQNARKNVHRMTANDGISARVKELQGETAQKVGITLEALLAELEYTRTLAKAMSQCSAMVQVTLAKAKLTGLI